MTDHEHAFAPIKTERSDLLILVCACGEAKVHQLPERRPLVAPTAPRDRDRILPLVPRLPAPDPWRPGRDWRPPPPVTCSA